jgi:hypothetical protein
MEVTQQKREYLFPGNMRKEFEVTTSPLETSPINISADLSVLCCEIKYGVLIDLRVTLSWVFMVTCTLRAKTLRIPPI